MDAVQNTRAVSPSAGGSFSLKPNALSGREIATMLFWSRFWLVMTETDQDRFRKQANECRALADKASSPLDKEAYLSLARDWTRLADGLDQIGAPGGDTRNDPR